MQLPPVGVRPRLHSAWTSTYSCNYHCPYCRLPPVVKHKSVSEWVEAWSRISDGYGRCYIHLSGGEPSAYPGFYDLAEALVGMHVVDVSTNLSWDVKAARPQIGPEIFSYFTHVPSDPSSLRGFSFKGGLCEGLHRMPNLDSPEAFHSFRRGPQADGPHVGVPGAF